MSSERRTSPKPPPDARTCGRALLGAEDCDPPSRALWAGLGAVGGAATAVVFGAIALRVVLAEELGELTRTRGR